ncbi:MAG TPA: CHAT domain-containing tetratricopeptide repeat protein [Pyrinomonadaceae bacterium]|nr:CHAT domain-containing tetratricopeptide repeat protein [Pyrinomonadaceae bacterium]
MGKPIEREIRGGERQTYAVSLLAGQYLKVVVKATDINLGVELHLPDDELVPFFEPFGAQPQESVIWVAGTTGIYRPTVFAATRASLGKYEIQITELRPSTEDDRALQQARELFTEYGRLNRASKTLEARTPLTQALEIRERVLGENDLLVAETLGFLANSYSVAGDYGSAEPLLIRAQKIFEKLLGPDHPRVARVLLEIAGLYQKKGDDLKAEEMDLKALEIYERAHLSDDAVVGSILEDLGEFQYARGDYENAEKYYERSWAIWEKMLGPDHFHLAIFYTHLGRVAYAAGDYSKAETQFQRALKVAENALGLDHTSVTGYRNDLAMVYCTVGKYATGEALYRQSLAVHEQKAAMGNPAVQETLLGLSRCSAAQSHTADAVKYQSQASELEERYVSLNLATGSEREKLAFLDNLNSRLSRTISLHVWTAPDDAAARNLAVTGILRRKGRVQDAMSAGLAALRSRFNPDDQKLFDQLNQTTAELARVVLSGPQEKTATEREQRIQALDAQQEDLEEQIGQRSAGFYQQTAPVTLAAVRSDIPAGAALIEFAIYRPFDPKSPESHKAYGEPRYVAYVVRTDGEVRWSELGSAKEIDAQVAQMRAALRDPERKDIQHLARELDARVMQPLRPLLGDATQLLVSPDGELNLVPFAALVDEQGRYLIQRYSFAYLTSGRDLLRLQVARESKSGPLIIANPTFGEQSELQAIAVATNSKHLQRNTKGRSFTTARSLNDIYFAPLAATDSEARSIQALFPDARVLTGPNATETAVKLVTAPRLLHLATHGFFLSETPAVAGGPAASTNGPVSPGTKIENPLLRSGLAFAGANLPSSNGDDGILTALEASGLNLWGTKLVVLSACDTGVGEVRTGEGVYGLRRAFTLAGAESLVMSLWPISDFTTRSLMTSYYQNLKQGMGRGEALRRVQLEMLKKNPKLHPFYWANFIQSGDWGNLEGRR